MSLKERYPYLATWKRSGWDKKKRKWGLPVRPQPSFPVDQKAEKRYLKNAEASLRNPRKYDFDTAPFLETDVQKILSVMRDNPITSHKRLMREKIIPEVLSVGFYVLKIQGKYFQRKITREQAADILARKFLPFGQGGKKIPDKTMRDSLRNAYKELMECVREIRVRLYIPLTKKVDIVAWPECTVEQILDEIPDALTIFNESELPLLVERFSIGDACLKVIHQRIKHLFSSPLTVFTERSVRELILKK